MNEAPLTPPLPRLLALVARLEHAGVVCGLGGSGLLMALGLCDHVNDWDLTTDEPIERVLALLEDQPFTHKGGDALHADQKLELGGGEIELIVRFAFHGSAGVVQIPTRVSGRWNGIPLASPEGWAVAYALLGRAAKSALVFGCLGRVGANAGAVAALLEQPLPPELAKRLSAVPIRTSSNT